LDNNWIWWKHKHLIWCPAYVENLFPEPTSTKQVSYNVFFPCKLKSSWWYYTHPQWKLYTFIKEFSMHKKKNICASKCRKWNSIIFRDVKFYQLVSKL